MRMYLKKFSWRQRSNMRTATSSVPKSVRVVRIWVWWSLVRRVTCRIVNLPFRKETLVSCSR